MPTTAGQFTGKKDNFGLLGGTGFKIAWREDLGKDPVCAFSAGDVLGDGTTRFVEYMTSQAYPYPYFLRISKWEDGNFDQKWQSENFQFSTSANCIVCVSHIEQKPCFITLSTTDSGTNGSSCKAWRWDGSTYSDALTRNTFGSPVIEWLSSLDFLSNNWPDFGFGLRSVSKGVETIATDNPPILRFGCEAEGVPTTGDFDGHGSIEIATVRDPGFRTFGITFGDFIEIWGKNGRKAITTKKYGSRLTTWNPALSKLPYIVACKSAVNDQDKPDGGYIYFIQWNGESYDEVWHSNKMDDAVIDMQVCDPKSEGKTGLVILSRQDKNYFLTKIVLAK